MNNDEDNEYDYPPTKHPWREFITMTLFGVIVLCFLIWEIWEIMQWLRRAL
jgi:hypothetical protein